MTSIKFGPRTGDVRIRAKSRDGFMTSWVDFEIYIVAEDGSEVPLTGVKSVEFSARQGDNEPLTAKIEVYVDELDIAAVPEFLP